MTTCEWCELSVHKKKCRGTFHKGCWEEFRGLTSMAVENSLRGITTVLPPLPENQLKILKAYLLSLNFVDFL